MQAPGMQLFLRTLDGATRTFLIPSESSVNELKQQIKECEYLPVCEQVLVANGRLLQDGSSLASSGITRDSTVHLLLRLCGGKGGFGALLRGQGRDGKITENYDACRDLSGRRLRHVDAEKKLKQWRAEAKERELEKTALKHIKDMAKESKRQKEHEVNVEQVRQEQRKAAEAVQDAIQTALAAAKADSAEPSAGAAAGGSSKRKAEEAAAEGKSGSPPKRAKPSMLQMLEGSDVDSDDSSDEE